MEEVNREVCSSSKEVEDLNSQVVDLKRQLQTLEIDLQAQLSLVSVFLSTSYSSAHILAPCLVFTTD